MNKLRKHAGRLSGGANSLARSVGGLIPRAKRPQFRTQIPANGRRSWLLLPILVVPLLLLAAGCAKFNTYYNAKRAFDNAEAIREDAIKKHLDPPTPAGTQKVDYEMAIKKAQKVLDEYPGHSLTEDSLFLQGKAHHRLEAYRQSIRKLDLLFQNYPATDLMEEALYLQGLNYLLIGALDKSQDYLDTLAKNYPDSKYQAETRKVSGDNAFAMKDWEIASVSYREYLDLKGEVAERDRVGLKLAQCYWELEDYYPAAEVLQEVSHNTSSADLAFRARLLRARVHVRMQDYEIVELLISQLRDEAKIYQSEGEVLLVEAEVLVAQDKSDEVAPLLQSMPTEWETPAVKARASEILGQIFLDRGEWEDAREKFQTAMLKKDSLEDEDRVRRLNDNLKDFLAADQALPDASGDRVARLKLLQANSLLFGFERPHMAATLYVEAAVDTAADTTDAARALYGAYLTYDQYLDLPDSASLYRASLEQRFPASPQAFEARAESGADLLGYLLTMRASQQAENLANLSVEDRAALLELGDVDTARLGISGRPLEGVRRRMVYLSRRDNLMFQPPERAVELISERQRTLVEEQAVDAMQQAQFDSLHALGQVGPAAVRADSTLTDEFGNTTPLDPNNPAEAIVPAEAVLTEEEKEAAAKAAAEKAEKKKKKEAYDSDFLR